MIEILHVLEDKEDYDKYCSLVKKHNTDNDITRIINNMGTYFKDTTALTVDWVGFSTYFFVKNPLIQDVKKTVFEAIFDNLDKHPHTALKSTLIDTFLQRHHAERIGFMALEVAEGRRSDLSDVQSELDTYMDISGKAAEIGSEAVRDDLATLMKTVRHGTGLRWRLPALNESLGAIRKGNFILIGGRPDAGKTTLLASECTHMVKQLAAGERVLYFTNEEGGSVVKTRIISSLLGVDQDTLEGDIGRYWSEYVHELDSDPDKILVIDKPTLSVYDIEWWLRAETPGLILIDQLRKVKGFDDLAGVNRLEKLFNQGREWSKEYAPVITVSQLDGNAENEMYPDMSRLYESKTAVQGEMDAIINIGRVNGSSPSNARYLNVVKNKLPTPDDPALRNGRHEVVILGDIGRFA